MRDESKDKKKDEAFSNLPCKGVITVEAWL